MSIPRKKAPRLMGKGSERTGKLLSLFPDLSLGTQVSSKHDFLSYIFFSVLSCRFNHQK